MSKSNKDIFKRGLQIMRPEAESAKVHPKEKFIFFEESWNEDKKDVEVPKESSGDVQDS